MQSRDRLAGGCALLIPPAVCAALIPSRHTFANTDAALVLVALIVAVASFGNPFRLVPRLAGYAVGPGGARFPG